MNYQNRVRPLFCVDEKCTSFLVSNRKKRLGKQAAYLSFVKLLEIVNLPKTGLHTLRHSIASHLTESGMASEQIADFLGHKTLDSTQIYVHFKKQ
jgi:integrase/recombinase XerD